MHYPSATKPYWYGGHRRARRARPRCRLQSVGRANTGSQGHRQTNFAHNFPRSLFETTRKRCNSNELISMFKQAAGELRAKLLRRQQDPSQTNFACNSIGPSFNKPRKRWDSNDTTSISKTVSGELHATLMIDSQNWTTCRNPGSGHTTSRRTTDKAQHRGARARRPAPPDATTQTRTLRSTCVRSRSARAARRSRRSSRSLRLRRRAGRRR